MAKHGSKQAFRAAAFVRKAYLYAFLQVSTKKAAGYRTPLPPAAKGNFLKNKNYPAPHSL
jgi:hypothetical protein